MSVVPMPQSPTLLNHHHQHQSQPRARPLCANGLMSSDGSFGGDCSTPLPQQGPSVVPSGCASPSSSPLRSSNGAPISMVKPKKPEEAYAPRPGDEHRQWVPAPKLTIDALGPLPQFHLSSQSTFEPFEFQVAGHDPILRLSEGIIFKPVLPRELWFYMNLNSHPRFVPWVPEFHGCISLCKDALSKNKNKKNAANSSSGGDGDGEGEKKNSSGSLMTPWGQKMHDEKLGEAALSSKPQTTHFMGMRDLTKSFRKPCIMDVKIGTRAYGDEATEAKMLSQTWKANNTTSSSVGLRICGIQVYQPDTDDYFYMHKYEGRLANVDDLKDLFVRYFSAEQSLRIGIISHFVSKLKELRRVVSEEPYFRFYATSLLLIYEGDLSVPEGLCPTPILKMIDFANTFPARPSGENDDGYLFGLTNFINFLEEILALSSPESQHMVYSQPPQ